MAIRGEARWVYYTCLDAANRPLAGDLANHTVNWTADGVTAQAANSQGGAGKHVEIGNGSYGILVTDDEADCDTGLLTGSSTTSGALIVPREQDNTEGWTSDQITHVLSQVNLLDPGITVAVVSALQTGGTLTLAAGADYAADEGKALQISVPAPLHAGSTASLAIGDERSGVALMVASGTFTQTGSDWYAVFDLTAAETAAVAGSLVVTRRQWDLLEVTPDGEQVAIYAGGLCNATRIVDR